MWQRVQGVGESFGLGVGEIPSVPLGVFDTDLAPEGIREDYYRAMLQGLICAASPRFDADTRSFRVQVRNGRLGSALYAHAMATPHRIERSVADIRAAPSGCYFLWREGAPTGGLYEFAGEQLRLAPGEVLVGDADRPLTVAETPGGGQFSLYLLPKASVDPLLTPRARDRLARGVAPAMGSPLHALLAGCLAGAASAESLGRPAAAGVGAVLARLAAIVADESAARLEPGREVLASARQARILQEIDRSFADPALGAAEAAARLGIAVRTLHLALEPTGLTFTEHLARRRLAEARTLLASGPARTVADVAFACGFNELSTFYRAFRRVYGAAPRD
jgi:AraC-like DNA-binding protein